MAAGLELRDIRKDFAGAEIIKGVSLSIAPSEFVVFVGPSGCGKSTLLRMIAGLETISSGDLLFDGERVNAWSPAQRRIGMVFQSYALYPHMTVAENVGFALKLAKVSRAERGNRVDRALETLQLTALRDKRPAQLSGGQRQRVAIGRAIVREPSVFLFDEPLSNLDASLRGQMRIEIGRLHQRLKNTVVYVTHDQVEAMTLADRVVVLEGGRVRQIGPPMELYERPANRFVAGFIGTPTMGFLDATVVAIAADRVTVAPTGGADLILPLVGVQAKIGDPVTIGIRPEHGRLCDPANAALAGRVIMRERLGADSFVYLDLPGAQAGVGVRQTDEDTPALVGTQAGVTFDLHHCHLFARNGDRIGAHIGNRR